MTATMLHTKDKTHDCWKAADLRGQYPSEISPELFERIGKALGTTLAAGARVLIAGDFRLSTLKLKTSLCEGLMSTGVHVLDAGQIPTPIAYFAATQHEPDAVLIVTASHNPPDDNGLKLLLEGRPPTPDQLVALRQISEGVIFRIGQGSLRSVSPVSDYERFIVERWQHLDPAALPEVILDAGNGAWSEIAPRVFSALNFQIRCLSCTIDGSFPDRPSDCSRPANLRQLRELVSHMENAVGIAWDGDGDRVAVVDETGYAVTADELSILMARELLTESDTSTARGGGVVIDLKLASGVQQEVERLGGIPLLERTGHAFMRARMILSGARLGLDACGHYFFGELDGADDGLFAALTMLDLLQSGQRPLHELLNTVPASHGSPELRIPLALLSFDEAEGELLNAFPDAPVNRLDGIRLTLPEGIILLRRSGTEPVISLRIEGFSPAGYESLLGQCLTLLPTVRNSVQSQLQDHAAPTGA